MTANLKLVGSEGLPVARPPISAAQGLHSYGSEAAAVTALPGAGRELGAGLTEAMVRFAARKEYARTVEDVLARRWARGPRAGNGRGPAGSGIREAGPAVLGAALLMTFAKAS